MSHHTPNVTPCHNVTYSHQVLTDRRQKLKLLAKIHSKIWEQMFMCDISCIVLTGNKWTVIFLKWYSILKVPTWMSFSSDVTVRFRWKLIRFKDYSQSQCAIPFAIATSLTSFAFYGAEYIRRNNRNENQSPWTLYHDHEMVPVHVPS